MIKSSFVVRFTECDPYGIASHTNYLVWLMECRIDYLKKCGLTEEMLVKDAINLVIVRVNLTCKNPCTYGDVVIVETKLKHMNKKSIEFTYVAKNEKNDKVIFEAETVNFVVNKEGKLCSLSDEIFKKLSDTLSE
jgi:YbgC/YbaW family acyl-CoA thioester hydrolase